VFASKGIRGFYRGMLPSTLREMGWTGGLFGLQNTFKDGLQEDSKFFHRNDVAAAAFASITAGQLTAIATQPFVFPAFGVLSSNLRFLLSVLDSMVNKSARGETRARTHRHIHIHTHTY
jgi:hypothetical protein